VIVLGAGILAHNIGKEVHLGVLLGKLHHNSEYNLESLQREVAIFKHISLTLTGFTLRCIPFPKGRA
jgi:hypothetical protein